MGGVERRNLVDAALMAAAGKRRVENAVTMRPASSGSVTRSPSARTLTSLCSRLSRADGSSRIAAGADAGDLVGRDGHADARPADEDAAVEVAVRDRARDGDGEVRVVHRLGRLACRSRCRRCRARRAAA